jgi:5'-3' exonuclease
MPPVSARPILHLVDGTGLVHRSFFAVRGLATRTGQPTGAIYGFINTIRALMGIEQPTHFVVTFDVSKSAARGEAFPEYKAHRPKMDEDLASQLPWVDKACEALRLPVVTAKGYEADDVIATLATQAVEQGFDVVIISSDKDLLQLVSDHVSVLSPGRDGKPEKRYDREGVIEKMGVPPERVVDLLALVGDAVDNIPGVPGIGEKGARDLLQQFGSLDDLLAHASEVKRAAYREGLLNHADKAHLSRQLATLDSTVPVTFDPAASLVAKPDREAAYQLFKDLEFTAFAREMAPRGHQVLFRAPCGRGGLGTGRSHRRRAPRARGGLLSVYHRRSADGRSDSGHRAGERRRRGLPRGVGWLARERARPDRGSFGRQVDHVFPPRLRGSGRGGSADGWAHSRCLTRRLRSFSRQTRLQYSRACGGGNRPARKRGICPTKRAPRPHCSPITTRNGTVARPRFWSGSLRGWSRVSRLTPCSISS